MDSLSNFSKALFALVLLLVSGVLGQMSLNISNVDSIRNASTILAYSTMKWYNGNESGQTPGLLPASGPWSWWEAGALMGQMIEYWYYTGDDTYNDVVTQALLFQTGPDGNYEPQNQTSVEGNDDQAFWGFAVMSAAEFGFPNPPPGDYQWLELAQAVFNRQAERWDTAHCDGGLRWQFNALNNGWMTKNSISNGCFFQLAARLARYTANDTYAYWANVTYDWMSSSPLMNADYSVFDSIGFTDTTCDTEAGQIQWTYNIGTMIAGCAYMYNYTQDTIWAQRLQGFLNHTQSVFFQAQYGGKTMVEYACEPLNTCNADQRSFKAYLARWLAAAIQLAPFTATQITPWLQTSALAAARVCTGSANDPSCGRKWYVPTNDGSQDVGNQLAAMSVVQSNLIYTVAPPYSAATGGNSTGDPGAGSGAPPPLPEVDRAPLTEADRAAAWFLTVLVMLAMVGFGWFLLSEKDLEDWPEPKYTTFSGCDGKWGFRTTNMAYPELVFLYDSRPLSVHSTLTSSTDYSKKWDAKSWSVTSN